MLRQNIRQREGFLQGITPRNIGNHYHSSYDYKDFVLLAGKENITSITDVIVGQILKIEPIYIIEAVGAKLFLTASFTTGGADSYTVTLYTDTLLYTYTSAVSMTTSLIEIDISEEFKQFFKNTDNKDIYIMVKVSNAATPLTIYGATVRIYTMTKDSFGSSQSKVTKYLDGNGLVEKDYLNDIQLKDEKLEYIAEITDDFGSR